MYGHAVTSLKGSPYSNGQIYWIGNSPVSLQNVIEIGSVVLRDGMTDKQIETT